MPRIVINNNATVDSPREEGIALAKTLTTTAAVRAHARSNGYGRLDEAYLVEGFKYGRKLAGLSENAVGDADFPASLRYKGKSYSDTGKRGRMRSTGEQAAEYENINNSGERVWRSAGGKIEED